MALLDILRASIPAVAAARGGYVQGERLHEADMQAAEDKRKAEERQSRLDAIEAALRQAQTNEANAQADYYRTPRPQPVTAPHTMQTDKGILQWDATTGTWKPTGYHPPAPKSPAGENPAVIDDRRRREGRLRTKDGLTATQAQLKRVTTDIDNAQADAQPGDGEAKGRVGQLIQQRNALRRDTDSLTAALKSPENAARYDERTSRFVPLTPAAPAAPMRGVAPVAPVAPKAPPSQTAKPADQRDVADAERAWKRIKDSRGAITIDDALNSAALTEGTKAQLKKLAGVP